MPKHVITSAVLYGSLAWVVFIAVCASLLMWGDIILPWAVSLSLLAGGAALVREARGSAGSWLGFAVLACAAVYVSGVL